MQNVGEMGYADKRQLIIELKIQSSSQTLSNSNNKLKICVNLSERQISS